MTIHLVIFLILILYIVSYFSKIEIRYNQNDIPIFRMYKLSNLCFNCAYLFAFLFLILSWSLDHIDVWLTQVVIPAVTVCVLLGFLFKYIATTFGYKAAETKKPNAPLNMKAFIKNTDLTLNDETHMKKTSLLNNQDNDAA